MNDRVHGAATVDVIFRKDGLRGSRATHGYLRVTMTKSGNYKGYSVSELPDHLAKHVLMCCATDIVEACRAEARERPKAIGSAVLEFSRIVNDLYATNRAVPMLEIRVVRGMNDS